MKFEVLHFQREPDVQNVRRLKKLFEKTGYDLLDVRNHVPVVIDAQSLTAATDRAGIQAHELPKSQAGAYAKLNFPPDFQLQCLHGVDRVQAASQLLPGGDQRLVVDLYLDGALLYSTLPLQKTKKCSRREL